MRRWLISVVAAVCAAGLAPQAAHATDGAVDLAVTTATVQTLDKGALAISSVSPATVPASRVVTMPQKAVAYGPTGTPVRVRLLGGWQIKGETRSVDLTNLRLNLPTKRASVQMSSPNARVNAFDISRVKVTKRHVRGVLLIAPGMSALLNEQFGTYVFSDGLPFARFRIAR